MHKPQNAPSGRKRFAVVCNRQNGETTPRVNSVDRCSMWLKHLHCVDLPVKGEEKLCLRIKTVAPRHGRQKTTAARLRDYLTLPHILPFIAYVTVFVRPSWGSGPRIGYFVKTFVGCTTLLSFSVIRTPGDVSHPSCAHSQKLIADIELTDNLTSRSLNDTRRSRALRLGSEHQETGTKHET